MNQELIEVMRITQIECSVWIGQEKVYELGRNWRGGVADGVEEPSV